MKKLDYIIIGLFLLIAFILWGVSGFNLEGGNKVRITINGQLYGEYSLFDDSCIDIDEGNIHNRIIIKDGYVYMDESSCSNKICVKQGKINNSGESICCAPNGLIVSVISEENGEYDAITH